MQKLKLLLTFLILNLGCTVLLAQQNGIQTSCDRNCLSATLDQYLAALVAHDLSPLTLASDYRATEDAKEIRLGEGIWQTVTGLGAYRVDLADPQSGNVGHIGELIEGDRHIPFALRLRVIDGHISEVETIVGRGRVPGAGIEPAPRPSLSRIVPSAERISRASMIATANSNFDAILSADGSIYADDCQRVENRMAMSGNPDLDYPIATLPGIPKPDFGAWGCREQIEAHLFDSLDAVEPRRFTVVDEEKQLVLGVYMLKWYKSGRCNDIPNYGRICPDTPRQPTALMNAELLGVRNGKIHEIEAVFLFTDYDATSGWTTDVRSPQ